jgi:glycosyltransferase involved in cell wall biosynthesis
MLYRTLRTRGHEVLLISFRRQYPQRFFPGSSDRDPSLRPLQVDEARYWLDSLNPLTWLRTCWSVYRYKPDGVILQWWTPFWSPVWLVMGLTHRFLSGRPLLFISHNVLPHEKKRWDPFLARTVLRLGTHVIVQSEQERERLVALIPGASVSVVPHPIYDMFAENRESQDEARRQLALPLETPILLFFGMVREYKGLGVVLDAMPEIRAQLGETLLVVAGEFWDNKDSYQEMIERLRLGDSVVIDDRYIPNEEVGRYFAAADVLVAPYRRVTGSGVVQMARGFGIPFITTAEDVDEACYDGELGWLVPPENSRALSDAVIRFFREKRSGSAAKAIPLSSSISSWQGLVSRVEQSLSQESGRKTLGRH